MLFCSIRKAMVCGVIGILSCFSLQTLAQSPIIQVQPEILPSAGKSFRPYAGKDWTPDKVARESIARYKFNQQRLQQQRATGHALPEAGNIGITDVNDISIVQDNGSFIVPAQPFTLTGRSVLYTPNGSGYTVTGGLSSYDTNFGTKLNLTQTPAVNSTNVNAEPGDDAYVSQPLGFNFSFYGMPYSSVAISSNGFLTFRPSNIDSQYFDAYSTDSGESLISLQTALPRIAAYWHDLDARAVSTTGSNGIYFRTDTDKVVITWNNVRDFPNFTGDNGIHRFQVTLFADGRILLSYNQVQLTSSALVGISGGANSLSPILVDFANPSGLTANAPFAEFFTTSAGLDEYGAIKAFYTAHPGQDKYDFVYVLLDFDYLLPNNAFAYYSPLRNDLAGNGQGVFDDDPDGIVGSNRMKGFLQLGSLSQYPDYPTTRFPDVGANHTLSVIGQEQGHYWLAYPLFPQVSRTLLLGRDNEHWSFFFNSESGWSHPAAPRSSNSEGSVWKDNGNGTFTTVNLIDGYSKLDQYLMGLRPADQVPDSFVIVNVTAPFGVNRTTSPTPNVTIGGSKFPVTATQVVQANGQVTPLPDGTQKSYRAAFLLIEENGQQPTQQTLNKVARLRLAWESYFAQSTDYLATINTGLTDLTTSRYITVTNGASYSRLVTPGSIASIFGQALTNTTVPAVGSLPTTLNGIEVKIDGTSAPLFFVSPGQINFEMPRTTAATTTLNVGGTVQSATSTVEIFSNGQLIRAGAVQVAPALIGTFTISQDGNGTAAALDAINFTTAPFNSKQGNGQPNIIAVFVTGLGAEVTDTDGDINGQIQATLNGQAVSVQYAGRAPGFVGLNQINFQLPANITAGTYNLTLTRNGFASNVTTITIK